MTTVVRVAIQDVSPRTRAARLAKNLDALIFPPTTCHGALANYITTADEKFFQPMNVTFGLLPPLEERTRKKLRKEKLATRALDDLKTFCDKIL